MLEAIENAKKEEARAEKEAARADEAERTTQTLQAESKQTIEGLERDKYCL